MDSAYSLENGLHLDGLTWREQDILSLLAERYTDREIAQDLGLALTTVKWYNQQIFGKLGVKNRREAAVQADALGLLQEQPDAAPTTLAPSKRSLPLQLTSFVGREREIAEAKRLLGEAHLLTLTGPAGTGKTRLALHVAAEALDIFEDGVCFVDLTRISQPELVGDTIAEALGVMADAGQPLTKALGKYLANKKLLLLVDNFEHLLGAAPLVGDLLLAAPNLSVLVTSREVLGLYGEQEYPVPPLRLPDLGSPDSPLALSNFEAVALFAQRAHAAKPGFTLNEENAPAVAEICVRLDGLPLAIELAAARVKLFSLQALLGQMENRFTALRDGPRNRPERQQTLRGAIDWSYELLDEVERTLFARLSVFQGGRTIEAVEAVCCHDLPIDVLDGLESLLNKNLLRHEEGPEGEPRFVMLETIHEYGRERLQESEEAEGIRRQHAEYFTALAERAEPYTRGGPDQVRWLRRLEADHDNLRTMYAWAMADGDIELALRLVGALGYFWFRQGHYMEGQKWTTQALKECDGASPAVRAALLGTAGLVAYYLQDHDTSRRRLREAAALYRQLGDKRRTGWALIKLSTSYFVHPEEYEEGVALCEESIKLLQDAGDLAGVALGLNHLSILACGYGDRDRARTAIEECLYLATEIGDKLRKAIAYANLSEIELDEGDPERAISLCKKSLALALEIENVPIALSDLLKMAQAASACGELERAARLLGAVEALHEKNGIVLQPQEQPLFENTVSATRKQLGTQTFDTAWEVGRSMRLGEAVAYALEEAPTGG